MAAMKLQRLCYYSLAWHLVWEEQLLFLEPVEAWANGPVCRTLYDAHCGEFRVSTLRHGYTGNPARLSGSERESIDSVLDTYAPMSAHSLSQLTHSEKPWQAARVGMAAGERGHTVITSGNMLRYYTSLTRDPSRA